MKGNDSISNQTTAQLQEAVTLVHQVFAMGIKILMLICMFSISATA